MYKVLIVDKEKKDREEIRGLLEKSKIETETAEVDNIEAALDYIMNNAVDVILIDVNDDTVGGLSFIKDAKNICKDVKVVIITGCKDFDCARQAVKLGVSDYILKPIEAEEFNDSLNRIFIEFSGVNEIDDNNAKNREYVMEHLLYLAINGSNLKDMYEYGDDLSFLNEFHRMILIDFNNDFFGNKGIDFKETFVKERFPEYTYLNLNQQQSLLLCKDINVDYVKVAERIISNVFVCYQEKCSVAVSSEFDGYDKMCDAMEELDVLISNKFYYSPGEVFFKGKGCDSDNAVQIDDDTIIKQMKQSIKMKDINGLRIHFDNFSSKYRNKTSFSQVYIKFLFANLLKNIYENMPEVDEVTLGEEVDELYRSSDFETVVSVVNKNIDRLEEIFSKNPQMIHREIEIVKQYIFEHYGEEISVDKLAELVYMAPSYLSSIFKKETGQNLSKFIKAYRMSKAKDMLENTMSKIIDISVICGYPNVSYFCSSFREHYGVSPQKYRENGENTVKNEQKNMHI